MAHKCLFCNVFVSDDRQICTRCLKSGIGERLEIDTGQDDLDVTVIDTEEKELVKEEK